MSKTQTNILLKPPVFRWLSLTLGLGLFFYFVPLFHLAPVKEGQGQNQRDHFNATEFVNKFWNGPLRTATRNAIDITELLQAFEKEPQVATKRFGHRLGLSNTVFYLVQGSGTLTSKTDERVTIALQGNATTQLAIEIGPVFSSAVRDATGLLDINQFANTQEFNAISTEINLKIENELFPKLQGPELAAGVKIHFAGAIEQSEKSKLPTTLNLIPVAIHQL